MEEATAGFVSASYFSNLLNDNIKQPGLDKLKAIAETMGFPAQLWLEEVEDLSNRPSGAHVPGQQGTTFRELLNNLFAAHADPETGEHPSNAEIARRTAGRVTREELERMRSGEVENPTLEQILRISEAFDVDPSYWLHHGGRKPLLNRDIIEAIRNEDNRLILHRSLKLSKDQKDMLLILMEQLQNRGEA